ncbi:MAG TPA: UDP-glucose/GDP-mannose dehydrogenase family protein [Nitrospira sp.]|nr:UDP-glucose/GDP-mannose dehydrogenase family protein [Nitrospira sp.]
MKISVMGTGYVGLVSGTCLAERGHQVTCIDIRPEVVQEINAGRPPIHEIGLDNLLRSARDKGMLSATTDAKTAILDSDVTLICVGTPTVDGRMDMSQIVAAAKEIGSALASKRGYHVVAVKSTVLPGTTEGPVKAAIESHSGKKVGDGWGLCMNPEFLREGRAVEDFRVPDRIVVGATDSMTEEVFLNVYADFTCPKLVTTPRTAEMIKYVSNSLLATMISFSNEIGNMCSAVPGVDARLVWKGVHLDRRLTPINGQVGGAAGVTEYLWHGLGFGGSCFPKDVAALRSFGRTVGEQTRMLDAVLDINADQPLRMVALLEKELSLAGKTVAVLGLAFKPGTDDLRESPALPLVAELRKKGAKVLVHDPIAMPHAKKRPEFRDVVFAEDWAEALRKSDACCLVTAWPEYRSIQPTNFQKLMTRALVIDGRGVFEPAAMAAAGVVWRGVGYTPEST